MNREKAIRMNADGSEHVLGCLWKISSGQLTSLSSDPFREGTKYYYIPAFQSLDCFKKSLADVISNGGNKSGIDATVLTGAKVDFKCVYLPVLRCGDRLLPLNASANHYIIKEYFSSGTMPLSVWQDCMINEMEDGCIGLTDTEILPIDLSPKEIDYLISYYDLDGGSQYEVIFCPVYCSELANDKQRFFAVQLASQGAEIHHEYPMEESLLLESSLQLVFVLFCLAAFMYFIFSGKSLMEVLTPLATDYFDIFGNFHESTQQQAYECFFLIGLLFAFVDVILGVPLWVLLGSVILSGLILFPVLPGLIISRLLFAVYMIQKKHRIIRKFCTIAKIDKLKYSLSQQVRLAFVILLDMPMPRVLFFVVLSGLYILLKYII